MLEFSILVLTVLSALIGLMVWERRGDSESAREIKALCKKQRREAMKAARKYPHTAAGCRY